MFPEVCSHSCSHVVIAPFTRVLYKRVYYKASTRHRKRQGPMGLQPRGVDSLTCTCTASRPVTILTERPLGRRGPATALVHEYAADPSGKGAWSAEVGAVPAWSASRPRRRRGRVYASAAGESELADIARFGRFSHAARECPRDHTITGAIAAYTSRWSGCRCVCRDGQRRKCAYVRVC